KCSEEIPVRVVKMTKCQAHKYKGSSDCANHVFQTHILPSPSDQNANARITAAIPTAKSANPSPAIQRNDPRPIKNVMINFNTVLESTPTEIACAPRSGWRFCCFVSMKIKVSTSVKPTTAEVTRIPADPNFALTHFMMYRAV